MIFLKRLFFALVLLYLLAPLVIIAGVSLNAEKRLFFPPQGLSLRWYQELFTNSEWLLPATRSLTIAALAALIAVSAALPLAYAVWRYDSRYARFLYTLGLAPFALPPIITGLGALALWIILNSFGRPYTVVLTHAAFLITLPLATISLGLRTMNPQLLEAATTMGANSATAFRTIIFPYIRPYILAGYIFAFVLSLNEYIIAFMTVGFTVETLPIKIFNSLRYGYTPVMASVSVIFFLIAVVLFGLIGRFGDLPKLLGADSRDS
jgi:putative spermidine/putrescine transport system permease protein